MTRTTVSAAMLFAMSSSASLAAEPTDAEALRCNQLGREIALQAAEQLSVTLDADSRTQLASIAELACLDYAPVAQQTAAPVAAPVETEEKSNEFFDLEVIDPADRVRRPGLKRP